MKFLVIFTLVDYQRTRRTALVLADSRADAYKELVRHIDPIDLDNLSKISFQRMDTITTMLRVSDPKVLSVIY